MATLFQSRDEVNDICNWDFLLTHNFLHLQRSPSILISFHTDESDSLYVIANRFYLRNRGPWLSSEENVLSLCRSAPVIVITPLNLRTRKTATAKSVRKILQRSQEYILHIFILLLRRVIYQFIFFLSNNGCL